jgi:hypothetical protein
MPKRTQSLCGTLDLFPSWAPRPADASKPVDTAHQLGLFEAQAETTKTTEDKEEA